MHIDNERCPQNHPCPAIGICPVKAISQTGNGLPVIDQNLCINCRKCIYFCPMHAITM